MKNKDYINVQGWMVNELQLSGNELLLFALIHGYSKDGINKYRGSINYVSEFLSISRKTVINLYSKLLNKEFISKQDCNSGNLYCTIVDQGSVKSTLVQKVHQGSVKSTPIGSVKSTPNIYNNINNIYIEPKQDEFTEQYFLKRWKQAREHFDKKPTNITQLIPHERANFNELKKDYSKEQFDKAIQGLFQQKTYLKTRLRPTHFLSREHFETYLTCFETKEVLFKEPNQQNKIQRI